VISKHVFTTGLGGAAPTPAVGVCAPVWDAQVVRLAPPAAPFQGTGLPSATATARLRGLGATGGSIAPAPYSARTGLAAPGVPAQRTTPGDLPPEGPLS
jgi:hypothetical protein